MNCPAVENTPQVLRNRGSQAARSSAHTTVNAFFQDKKTMSRKLNFPTKKKHSLTGVSYLVQVPACSVAGGGGAGEQTGPIFQMYPEKGAARPAATLATSHWQDRDSMRGGGGGLCLTHTHGETHTPNPL